MTSNIIYHYVYRITNLINNKHYYGKRSSKIEAKLDLGLKYYSSCQLLKKDIKKCGSENFKFKIIKQFKTAKDAIIFETYLHKKFDVKNNNNFYNNANQTGEKFDTTGKAVYYNTLTKQNEFLKVEERKNYHLNVNKGYNPYYNTLTQKSEMEHPDIAKNRPELQGFSKGKIAIHNKLTKQIKFIKPGEYENNYKLNSNWGLGTNSHHSKGKTNYKNIKTGKTEWLSTDDPRIGKEYVHMNINTATFKNIKTGKIEKLKTDDPRIGIEYVGTTKGFCTYKNIETEEYEYISIDNPEIGIKYFKNSHGHANYKNIKTGETEWLSIDDPRIGVEYEHISTGITVYKHIKTDERIKLKTDDPRIGVEYVGIKKKKKKYIDAHNNIIELYDIDPIIKQKSYKLIKEK
jgi:hypothetical protein